MEAALIYPAYPPELTPGQSAYLISNLKDWSIAHGLAVRPAPTFVNAQVDPTGVLANSAPVTLFPSLFPRMCFHEAESIQKAYNKLYSGIARDERWLKEIVEDLGEVDDFIANLWNIHMEVKKEGYVQNLSLGLFRSDYMVHVNPTDQHPKPSIKQVEFNTIASSFGGLSTRVSELHSYLNSIGAYPSPSIVEPSSLPPNKSINALASGLSTAHHAYGPAKTSASQLAVIFLVQDLERNVFDQRHLEYALRTNHSIAVYRLPFRDILKFTTLSLNGSRALLYSPPHSPTTVIEITTVYFRAGYDPTEYTHDSAWVARLHLERSAAIKCPSVLTHLAGSKKIQQVLATPRSPHLARFLVNPGDADRVRDTFANIYPLDNSEAGLEAQRLALNPKTAKTYVLKPQREGGGHNVYRAAIPGFLKEKVPKDKWKGYILMELIEPPALNNSILRDGRIESGGVIGELGVYGVCLWWGPGRDPTDRGHIMVNYEAGYLLRTKGRESEEGGVAAGFGCVDSALLVDV